MNSDSRNSRTQSEPFDEAVADLQMRLTYQDDEIRNLNLAVDRHRSEIETLKVEIDRLKKLVAVLALAQAGDPQDEIPPHY